MTLASLDPAGYAALINESPHHLRLPRHAAATPRGRRAFTLVELLVVIAIIALLISILLPALARARKSGQMAVSLSNLRQQGLAAAAYRENNKSRMPFGLSYLRGMHPSTPGEPPLGFVGFSYGGKNNDPWWGGREFDVEAADRPLNPYLYPEADWGAPDPPERLAKTSPARKLEARVYRDPADAVSYQRQWPAPSPHISSYNDVGTSYHFNTKWWDPLHDRFGPGESAYRSAFETAVNRLSVADSFNPSRFVWLNDQYADLVVHAREPGYAVRNGYEDVNKSLMAFMDGHAAYLSVTPGDSASVLRTERYSFVFDDIPGR